MANKIINNLQPVGIIKTMPKGWIEGKLLHNWEQSLLGMNHKNYWWEFNLSGQPKYQVLYFYLLYDGAIRIRLNIIGFAEPGFRECFGGETRFGKCWIKVSSPVIKLKTPVPVKGFQGFRYTSEVYR